MVQSERRIISWQEYDVLLRHIEACVGQKEPDCIVGLTRGGLVPAVQLSHVYNAPLFTLNVSLRDGKVSKSKFDWKHLKGFSDILIVDDINDSGDTLNYVMEMFRANKIFCPRTAVLLSKETSSFQTTFAGEVINKDRKDEWIVFPWE